MELAIAVVLAAVLFADRFSPREAGEEAGQEETRRRLYQIGLAFTLALFVITFSSVVFPAHAGELSLSSENPETQAAFQQLKERFIFISAGGLMLLLVGLIVARRSSTLYLSALLAGLVVLASQLFNSGTAANPIYLISEGALTASQTRNAVYSLVLAIGIVALAWYGCREWERDASREEDRLPTG